MPVTGSSAFADDDSREIDALHRTYILLAESRPWRKHMNIREVPQPAVPAPVSTTGKGGGRFGIDPISIGSRPRASRSPRITASTCSTCETAPWPRYGVNGRGGASERPRRLRQHVRARDRARQIDGAAASSLRRGRLCARGHGSTQLEIAGRQPNAASNGARRACSPFRSTPSTGTSTAAAPSVRCWSRTTNLPMMMNVFHNEPSSSTAISISPSAPARRSIFPARAISSPSARAITCGRRISFPISPRSS